MGLLDDLKKQAAQLKARQQQTMLTAENLVLVDGRMKQAFIYLNDLLNQIKVLKPQNPLTYALPGIGELRHLAFEDTFIDYRHKKINDKDYYDSIHLLVRWQGAGMLTVERDMPGTIERTREVLWQSKVKFEEDETQTQYGTVSRVRFRVHPLIVTEITIKADYEHQRLLVHTNNLLRAGTDHFEVPAQDINETTLENLARMLMGENSEFRKFRSTNITV
jgi:hypothetical protein